MKGMEGTHAPGKMGVDSLTGNCSSGGVGISSLTGERSRGGGGVGNLAAARALMAAPNPGAHLLANRRFLQALGGPPVLFLAVSLILAICRENKVPNIRFDSNQKEKFWNNFAIDEKTVKAESLLDNFLSQPV